MESLPQQTVRLWFMLYEDGIITIEQLKEEIKGLIAIMEKITDATDFIKDEQ